MSTLRKYLERMDIKELQEVEHELKEGSIQRLLEQRLSTLEQQEKTCPVCNRQFARPSFVLEFGPPDFRQRANFDGIDCLDYFVTFMKKRKEDEYY